MKITQESWEVARRRLRVYGGRLRRVAIGKGISPACLFLHLPKCGGTSLSEALYSGVPFHQRIGVIDAVSTRRAAAIDAFDTDDLMLCHEDLAHGDLTFALREKILLAHMCWDTRLIHGHVLYTDKVRAHTAGRYKVVTIMRDPVARTLSNFRMAAHNKVIPPDIEEWLSGPVGFKHATVNLRYLGGRASLPPEEAEALLPRALAAVDEFELIGFLDETPRFLRDFEKHFGTRLSLPRSNEAKGARITLDAGQTRRLEALCAFDIEIYRRARERFGVAL